MSDSPVDELLEELRAGLHARRAALVERVDRIQLALNAYKTSAEERIAHDFALEHGLKRPKLGPTTPARAAERLHSLVSELPELGDLPRESVSSQRTGRVAEPSEPARVSSPPSGTTANPARLSALVARSRGRKLVILGALAGRNKAGVMPEELEARTEWVDTERDGAHAIGNLPQRVRQQRVAAIVILDKAVQHKHTDPVVAAARDAKTPVAFAGKGGRASLVRALEQLDERLRVE